MAFALESPAFPEGGAIPRKYARDGENLSPPLIWKDAPAGIRSFVLIMEDPDAPSGTFHHWGVYDMDRQRERLPEGAGSGASPENLRQGVNDFGNARYDGPQPPKGHGVHHYHFRLAALDVDSLPLGGRPRVLEIRARSRPHIIAEAELVGTYENK
jgi:Raf kinase inhibitor-like YbhB/YbcL family protein